MGRHSKALFEEEGQLSHMQPARALSELGTDSLVFQTALTSVDVWPNILEYQSDLEVPDATEVNEESIQTDRSKSIDNDIYINLCFAVLKIIIYHS